MQTQQFPDVLRTWPSAEAAFSSVDLITQDARNSAKYIFRTGEPHAADEKEVAIFCRCYTPRLLSPSTSEAPETCGFFYDHISDRWLLLLARFSPLAIVAKLDIPLFVALHEEKR
jgi:hypothetical protein